jgi:protein involved in polysaccharide export with SLBB domain
MSRLAALSRMICIASLMVAPVASAIAQSVASAASETGKPGYTLGVDDKVTIVVFGEDSLSKEYSIGPNGMISVPLIGNVQALGKTAGELQTEIATKLAAGYIKDPSVSIQITTFRPFYILGEVTKPGEYPFRDGLTVTAAVATAEGFTYRARKKYVFIKHSGAADEVRVDVTPNLLVQPGDTIRFAERHF